MTRGAEFSLFSSAAYEADASKVKNNSIYLHSQISRILLKYKLP